MKHILSAILIFIATTTIAYSYYEIAYGDTKTIISATVLYNNCNISNSSMPVPEIIAEYPSPFGTNFIARIGSSLMFSIWRDTDTLDFYLDDATWTIDNGEYIAPVCNL